MMWTVAAAAAAAAALKTIEQNFVAANFPTFVTNSSPMHPGVLLFDSPYPRARGAPRRRHHSYTLSRAILPLRHMSHVHKRNHHHHHHHHRGCFRFLHRLLDWVKVSGVTPFLTAPSATTVAKKIHQQRRMVHHHLLSSSSAASRGIIQLKYAEVVTCTSLMYSAVVVDACLRHHTPVVACSAVVASWRCRHTSDAPPRPSSYASRVVVVHGVLVVLVVHGVLVVLVVLVVRLNLTRDAFSPRALAHRAPKNSTRRVKNARVNASPAGCNLQLQRPFMTQDACTYSVEKSLAAIRFVLNTKQNESVQIKIINYFISFSDIRIIL